MTPAHAARRQLIGSANRVAAARICRGLHVPATTTRFSRLVKFTERFSEWLCNPTEQHAGKLEFFFGARTRRHKLGGAGGDAS